MYNFCKIALRHFHQQIPETILVQLQHPWKDMTKEERDAAPLQVKVSQEQHILYELGKLFGQMEYNQILDVSEDHPDNDKYLLYQKTLGILRGYGLINDHTPLIMKIFGITEDNVAWRGFSFCSPREFLTPLKKIRMEVKREYAKKIIPVTKLAREPFPGYSRTIALTQMSQWLF
jgi:hypothetical protein